MTNGELLKQRLGLDTLKSVKINRAVLTSRKILFVWYDSTRPDMPVTNYRVKKFPWVATIFHGTDLYHGETKNTVFTPPIDIEDYNGALRGTLVVPVNLAGDRFIDEDDFSKIFESEEQFGLRIPSRYYEGNLFELSLYDLADKGNISDFTMKWRKDRNRIMGGASRNTKLVDCVIDEAEGSATFQFLTEATELDGADPSQNIDSSYRFYDGPKQEVDPETLKLNRNRGKVYELQIKVFGVVEWVEAFEGEKLGKKELRQILEANDVQIFSTSPSFQLQGFNYWNTQLDSSIHPEGRKPRRWDKYHGDGEAFLDKHLYSLFQNISFFLNQMAQKLNSKLRQRGLL